MVLSELGTKLTAALGKLAMAEQIDEKTFNEVLLDIQRALIGSDVNVGLVAKMRDTVRQRVNLTEVAAGINRAKLIRQVVMEELKNLVDPGVKPYNPKRGKSNVIMLVGLQGSGKTTTATKLAYYYKKKGFRPGLVCADTFRAGAFAQLRQNATRAKIPFYGSESDQDPAKVAGDGVERFKKENSDLIIVDTSGRHKQEEELFVEMEQVAAAVKPNLIIFVMDGSIGQAAQDQAEAFKKRVEVGAVIVTKLDGHAKGGGALSAVAATKSPIIFLGTGERIPDLQSFEAESFVQRLLGLGDMKELLQTVEEAIPKDQQERLVKKMQSGTMTLRDVREQLQATMKMGPLDKVMQMIPGFSNMQLPDGMDPSGKLKNFINIMDSMTNEELDSPNPVKLLTDSRLERISRGSGRPMIEVKLLLEQYKMFESFGKLRPTTGKNGMPDMRTLQKMSSMLPPGVLNQMGGAGGLRQMMQQMSQNGFQF